MDANRSNDLVKTVLFVSIVCALADKSFADEALFSEPWRWATFTTESGLPANEVLELVETPKGTTWVSTRKGIAWYDGYQWKRITEAQGLPAGSPSSIAPLGDDRLLVILQNRLCIGDAHGFTQTDLSLNGEAVLAEVAVALDERRILVQARPVHNVAWGIYLCNDGKISIENSPARISSMPRTRLRWTRDGSVWLTTDAGLMRWSGQGWEAIQPAEWEWYRISDLATNRNGEGVLQTIFPRVVAGLWTWGADGRLLKDDLASQDSIQTADVDPHGDILAVCQGGCVKYRRSGQWINVKPVPSRMEVVSFVRFASSGELWIGTPDGLHLYRNLSNRWEFWQNGDSTHLIVNALLAARDGTVWVGMGHGIDHCKADGTLIESFDHGPDGIEFAPITGLAEDEDGGIWACSGSWGRKDRSYVDGAVRWDGQQWKHFGRAEGLDAPFVHRIYKDREGRLWFMGMGPGHQKVLQPGPGAFRLIDGQFERWGTQRGLPSGRMYCMAEQKDRTLWFGTLGGLSRFRDNRWKHWTVDNGLKHSRIQTVAITTDDRLWFGHQGQGMGYINEKDQVQYVTSPVALFNAYVLDLQVDWEGRLWVGSSAGLYSLHNGIWSEFTRSCGLINNYLWPVVPLKDRVLVGTDGSGVGILHITAPDRIPPRVVLNPPALEETSAWFSWSANAYQAVMPASRIQTRYRLDDQAWSPWSEQRETSPQSLDPGHHRFDVQAKGLFGDMSPALATEFEITPPVYRRPGIVFPILGLTAALLIVGAAYVIRRRRHELAVRTSEQRLQAILDNTPACIYVKDPAGRYLSINRRFEGIFHIARDAIIGKTDYDVFPREIAGSFRENDLRVIKDHQPLLVEETAPHDDGPHRYISAKFPLFNLDGTLYATCGVSTDITERIRSAEMLQVSEERFRSTLNQAAVGISETDLAGRYLLVNQRFCDIVGRGREEMLAASFQDITHPEDLPGELGQFRSLLAGDIERYSIEKRYVRKDGSCVWVNLSVSVVREASGNPRYATAIIEDIAERKRAQEALQNEQTFLKALLASISDGIVACDADGNVTLFNDALAHMHGLEPGALPDIATVEGHLFRLDGNTPLERPQLPLFRALAGEEVKEFELLVKPRGRRAAVVASSGRPIVTTDGRRMGAVVAARDITQRKAAEDVLRRHALVFDNIHDGVILTDTRGAIADWNPGAERIFGYDRESILGKSPEILNMPAQAAEITRNIQAALRQVGRWAGEVPFVRKDGSEGVVEAVVVPMLDEERRPIGVVSVNRDITARKRAEAEREALEGQLRQAQKMEAIGTLASGVAHDFNNLLHAIFGYTELAKTALPPEHPGALSVEMVEHAAQQARGVVNALLTFSRKDVVEKSPGNVTVLVQDTISFIRRVLPAAIQVATSLDSDVWVLADSTQIQQVLMNLAVNARDAMHGAGRMRVELRRRSRDNGDDFAVLSVEDDGEGMSVEVLARLFEPFFTTKPHGEGTGLGLSVIHGIVASHGGHVDVESQLGQGTKMTVTLPCCQPPTPSPHGPCLIAPAAHAELILVIQDNEHVRSIMTSTLRARGYRVIAADSAQAVERIKECEETVRLVILDVDIGEPSGLADLRQCPLLESKTPMILISGTGEIDPCWAKAANRTLLQKPFQMQELVNLASHCLSEIGATPGAVA